MSKGRLEAFSDGVLAIVITIMVLELKAPSEPTVEALRPLVPEFLSYVLSFVFVGIYWNNHHHLLQAARHVTGWVLWANLHLLFWLSLTPFIMAWMGENVFESIPTAAYGCVLLMSAIAYTILERTIIAYQGPHSKLAAAVGKDIKAYASLALYLSAIPLAFVKPLISDAIYVTVALIWLVPDRRIEKRL